MATTAHVTVTEKIRDLGLGRKSRYQVRWKVAGAPERTVAFATKKAARAHQARLIAAVSAGELFDVETREPVSWGAGDTGPNVAEFTADRLVRNWGRWKGSTRRSAIEGAACWLPALAGRNFGDRATVERALKVVLNPNGEPTRAQRDIWRRLVVASPKLGRITQDRVSAALAACATKLDGTKAAEKYERRRRTTLGEMFNEAVSVGHLERSPLAGVKTTLAQQATQKVDAREIGEPEQVFRCLEQVASVKWRCLYAMMFLAGLRPSEAVAVRWRDFTQLPPTGWGELRLRAAAADAGKAYSDSGATRDEGGLKWRRAGETRTVPLPPRLVRMLREYRPADARLDDLCFPGRPGGFASSTTVQRVWKAARDAALPDDAEPLLLHRPYSLRHSAASLWLGVPGATPQDVAERLGHSTAVLLDVYADVLPSQRERANTGIDAAIEEAAARVADSDLIEGPEAEEARLRERLAELERLRSTTASEDPL